MNKKNSWITYNNKRYMIDFNQFKKICLISSNENSREKEITNGYTLEDDGLLLTSKIERELKSEGNPQNDIIMWDLVKILITKILEGDAKEMTPSLSIAFNTLIMNNILIEIE